MYSINNENELILPDIVNYMSDYCSIQLDIDETKAKAAELVAQRIYIGKLIGKENLQRCKTPVTEADEQLKELIIPALCYYTYGQLLKLFPGTFTDGGYSIDKEATDTKISEKTATEYFAIAEVFMEDVMDFLRDESPNDTELSEAKVVKRVRVIGGKENRASN